MRAAPGGATLWRAQRARRGAWRAGRGRAPPDRSRSGADADRPPRREAASPLEGWLALPRRGFGFVTAEDGGAEVFIPPNARGEAYHGDRVRVRVRSTAKGREGEVLRVLRRGLARVAGTLRIRGSRRWIEPGDARLPDRVEIVGTMPLGVAAGDDVVAQYESFPIGEDALPTARVLSRLGRPGSAAVEVEKIKIREGVEEDFEEHVLAEAQRFGTAVRPEDLEGRVDLRDLELCTIDPPDARDHDDAVWAERRPDGGFRVVVAIADVSHYVREGSALDAAALARGTSIYLPDRVIPMLPPELSSNLASLVPHEDRLTLAVEVELGPRGAVRSHRFLEGVLRSRARLHYAGVARALRLSEGGDYQHEAEERRELLTTLFDVAHVLRLRRLQRGSIDFELPEPQVVLDDAQEPLDVRRSRSGRGLREAYRMIEDLMLLANEVVATDLAKRDVPAIFRVHGQPREGRIAQFAELAASLGYVLDEDAARTPRALAKFLQRVEGSPHAQALNYLLLRSMQQATYDTTNVGHFALAARNYLHFTSPIRRYPDLAVHRVVRSLIRGERIDRSELRERLTLQAAESSRRERRAMVIDRETTDLYRAILMKDRVGESFDATVTGVSEGGLDVTFEEPFVEARCPIAQLGDDWFELDSLGLRLTGRRTGRSFALGDRLTVRLGEVSIERRELTARPEGKLPDDRELYSPAQVQVKARERRQRGDGWARGKRRRGGAEQGSGGRRPGANGRTKNGRTKKGRTKKGRAKKRRS
ncbi:MAG: ribonuclease R family protein [Sandaracinaceae bacterium]